MKTNQKKVESNIESKEYDFVKHVWGVNWIYIKTIADIVREPILILDKDLRVMTANESFCRTFQVENKDTEGEIVYKLGNGQWDIPDLRKLLEDILPKNTFFKGFEVTHNFPFIGRKIMILNARQIHFKGDTTSEQFPPILLLAMEDVTDMMLVAETLATHVKEIADKNAEQTRKLEKNIDKLEKEVDVLKHRTNASL